MPDITMCINNKCSLKYKCKRHVLSGTIPSEYQSIFMGEEIDGKCKDYWEKCNV